MRGEEGNITPHQVAGVKNNILSRAIKAKEIRIIQMPGASMCQQGRGHRQKHGHHYKKNKRSSVMRKCFQRRHNVLSCNKRIIALAVHFLNGRRDLLFNGKVTRIEVRVRGAVRGSRVGSLRSQFRKFHPVLELTPVYFVLKVRFFKAHILYYPV